MASQIDRVLDGVWVGLHTCTLGTFSLYTLALSMPICNKKLHSTRAVESHKNFIVVTLLQWKVSDFLQLVSGVIFCCKSAYLEPRGITKTSSTYKYLCNPTRHPCPIQPRRITENKVSWNANFRQMVSWRIHAQQIALWCSVEPLLNYMAQYFN